MSLPSQQEPDKSKIALPDYPLYPINEDIFNQSQLEENIDPEDISKMKSKIDTDVNKPNEKDF